MRTKLFKKVVIAAVLVQASFSAALAGTSLFSLEWDSAGLPIKVKTYLVPKGSDIRDNETGVMTEKIRALLKEEIPGGKVRMWDKQQKAILLVIENLSDKDVDFSVAPHHTAPVEESMNFKFFCLCNGHIYHIPAKGTWYRQMKLKSDEGLSAKDVILRHTIYAAKKK